MDEGSCSEEFLKAMKLMISVVTLPPDEARKEMERIEENCKDATKSCPLEIQNIIETHLRNLKVETEKFLPTTAEERLFALKKSEIIRREEDN